jgi:uncharacterized protein DUF1573
MKRIISVLILLAIAHIAFAQQGKIEFEQLKYEFGEIVQGDTVEYTFKFQNTGVEPLKILSARGSCGCTVPSYSKEAIAPGAKGEVFVRFKSAGKRGMQNKTVTLTTDALETKQVILTLRGTVKLPSNGD